MFVNTAQRSDVAGGCDATQDDEEDEICKRAGVHLL
jgi:hypothetical protein